MMRKITNRNDPGYNTEMDFSSNRVHILNDLDFLLRLQHFLEIRNFLKQLNSLINWNL